jgi:hypothetical protein
MSRKIKINSIYKHFKGNLYKVIAIGKYSEDERLMVVYQALYGNNDIWIRDYEMFNSFVDKEKYPNVKQKYRFEEIKKV